MFSDGSITNLAHTRPSHHVVGRPDVKKPKGTPGCQKTIKKTKYLKKIRFDSSSLEVARGDSGAKALPLAARPSDTR